MANITIKRGSDGFGSQLLSIISGIRYCELNGHTYYHTPIENIKLVNYNTDNAELSLGNRLINSIISNMNIKMRVGEDCQLCRFFHNEVFANPKLYYNDDFISRLSSSYPLDFINNTTYNANRKNISIHIRRGSDILDSDKRCRYIGDDTYINIINILKNRYPDYQIHIFSWDCPFLKPVENVIFHTTNNGYHFMNDFDALVKSDILVVGSSTFSICAGLFNKNTVICSDDILKLDITGYPVQWKENYERILYL